MDHSEYYFLTKKLIYVIRLFKLPNSSRLVFGSRGRGFFPDILSQVLPEQVTNTLEDTWDSLRDNDDKGRRQIIQKVILELEKQKKKYTEVCTDHQKNLQSIATLLDLSPDEVAVLECLIIMKSQRDLEDLLERLEHATIQKAIYYLSILTSVPKNTVRKMLEDNSSLVSSGLLEIDPRRRVDFTDCIEVSDLLVRAFEQPYRNKKAVWNCFFQASPASKLEVSSYSHFKKELKNVSKIIHSAIKRKQKGVNILCYGGAGTGKTEFVRFIAKYLKLDLYTVVHADDQGKVVKNHERIASLMLCDRALKKSKKSTIIFDEADNILNDNAILPFLNMEVESRGGKKAWLTHTLENNFIPTFWVVNHYHRIEPAFLRRFSYSIKFEEPSKIVRKTMWEHVLNYWGFRSTFSEKKIELLAKNYEVCVGEMDKAVETSTLLHSKGKLTLEKLETVLAKMLQLKNGGVQQKKKTEENTKPYSYDLELLNVTPNYQSLLNAITSFLKQDKSKAPFSSLTTCFYGPPGTGKTEFARYIANHFELPLHTKKASDLFSKWVGETESNTAKIFAQAQEEGAILLVDEIDSFLQDRESAKNSWEVSQVNEFLTQLENFRGIFIGSTNLVELLDPASIRRFSFKLRFQFLNDVQKTSAFKNYFQTFFSDKELSQYDFRSLLHLKFLTLGDFKVVQQMNFYQPENCTVEVLIQQLEEEMLLKRKFAKRVMGF